MLNTIRFYGHYKNDTHNFEKNRNYEKNRDKALYPLSIGENFFPSFFHCFSKFRLLFLVLTNHLNHTVTCNVEYD